jgi:hypothetical protein
MLMIVVIPYDVCTVRDIYAYLIRKQKANKLFLSLALQPSKPTSKSHISKNQMKMPIRQG